MSFYSEVTGGTAFFLGLNELIEQQLVVALSKPDYSAEHVVNVKAVIVESFMLSEIRLKLPHSLLYKLCKSRKLVSVF